MESAWAKPEGHCESHRQDASQGWGNDPSQRPCLQSPSTLLPGFELSFPKVGWNRTGFMFSLGHATWKLESCASFSQYSLRIAISSSPKDHISMTILRSDSKAQKEGDSRHHGLEIFAESSCLCGPCGPGHISKRIQAGSVPAPCQKTPRRCAIGASIKSSGPRVQWLSLELNPPTTLH